MTSLKILECLLIGAAGGLLAGLFGVGGGIIMVPLLMIFMKMGIHDAKAQSLAIIMLTSVTGTVKSYQTGRLEWMVILLAGLAAAMFSPIGVTIGEKMDRQVLTKLFALLMILTGIRYLIPSAKPASPPPPAAASASVETK